MSPKLPVNNAQTISDFLNLKKGEISEKTSRDSSKFAFDDPAFLARRETLGIRFELELLKPDILLREQGIDHTINVFGSARFVSYEQAVSMEKEAKTSQEVAEAKNAVLHSKYYESAREFGKLVAAYNGTQLEASNKLHICTGGGPGIMEAANRGAYEAGDQTIGFNISLPREQHPNPYISEGLAFRFHYFALRKMQFMLRARAILAYPGGFGSFDELFEALTLMQTGKVALLPVILVDDGFWSEVLNLEKMIEFGVIDKSSMDLIHFVDSAEEAWKVIVDWYQLSVPL